MNLPALFAWIFLGLPAMAAVTFVAGRMLGAKRGWLALTVSGVVGWTAAVLLAGELTNWRWDSIDMVLVSLAIGPMLTMVCALGLDFLSPVGSLASGEAAGLVTVRNPIETARIQRDRVARYREVVRIARRNGIVRRRVDAASLPDGVRHTLEQAGGIFVKLGQVASTRNDVLPQAWCDELGRLRSGAEPAPELTIRPVIEEELQGPVEVLYAEFDWTPLASASIAQVYSATLRDGTPVVVKAQRPGLQRRMEVDRGAILQIAGFIERNTPLGLSVKPTDLATEFLDNVAEELDFMIEANNARELADGLAAFPGIRIPATYPELSTSRVLTEERVSGVSVADVEALRAAGVDPAEASERLITAFLSQMFEVGVFHADPHPGNILVEPDGTIVLIDLGAVGRLGPGQRAATLELLMAASLADATGLRVALTEIVDMSDEADLRALERSLERMLARHMHAGGGMTAAAFQDLSMVIAQFGLRFPDWLATLIRTMVTLEGTLKTINPAFSLVEAARDHAGDFSGTKLNITGLRATVEHEAMRQMPRLRRLPERVDSLLGQAVDGRLSMRLSFFGDPKNEQVLSKLVDRMVLAILAAALGLGSVLLIDVQIGPELGGHLNLNEVLGYVGLAAASILSLRVIAGVIRDGSV
jgi:ubiquinone biosynthesis protein